MSIIKLLDGNGYIADGEILFDGKDLAKASIQDIAKIRGNDISVIFQEPMTSLNPVLQWKGRFRNHLLYIKGWVKKKRQTSVEMLSLVKIPNPESVAKQYPHQLSGGMRQRVMIAMALACVPKL